MSAEDLFTQLPLWAFFLGTIVMSLLAVEVGFRLGRYQHQHKEPGQDAPVGGMVGATLGLLAFMLAFTFSMAGARFEARKQLVLDEANAIGTAYRKAELLPQPQSSEARTVLREYVDVRVMGATQREKMAEAVARSEELHRLLWSQAVTLARKDPTQVGVGLFVQSVDQVIELHVTRMMVAGRGRIPVIIWMALYFLAILAMAGMGYQMGLASSRRSIVAIFLTVAFSSVIGLTADLDRGTDGFLRVSQQAMVDLQQSMSEKVH
jgi:hypothetical protein